MCYFIVYRYPMSQCVPCCPSPLWLNADFDHVELRRSRRRFALRLLWYLSRNLLLSHREYFMRQAWLRRIPATSYTGLPQKHLMVGRESGNILLTIQSFHFLYEIMECYPCASQLCFRFLQSYHDVTVMPEKIDVSSIPQVLRTRIVSCCVMWRYGSILPIYFVITSLPLEQ